MPHWQMTYPQRSPEEQEGCTSDLNHSNQGRQRSSPKQTSAFAPLSLSSSLPCLFSKAIASWLSFCHLPFFAICHLPPPPPLLPLLLCYVFSIFLQQILPVQMSIERLKVFWRHFQKDSCPDLYSLTAQIKLEHDSKKLRRQMESESIKEKMESESIVWCWFVDILL